MADRERRFGPLQVVVDAAPRDRAAAGEFALSGPQLVMQTENFFDLAHGQSPLGHDVSSTELVEGIAPSDCPASRAPLHREPGSFLLRSRGRFLPPDSGIPITIPKPPDQ